MRDLLLDVAGNLIASVVVIIVVLLIALPTYRSVKRVKRDMAIFFGLRSNGEIHIVLSRYKPVATVVNLAEGVTSTGWSSETVAMDEFRGAEAVKDLFGPNWIALSFMAFARGLVNDQGFHAANAVITTASSGLALPGNGTVVLLGTGAGGSNVLADHFLGTHNQSRFKFIKQEGVRAFERLGVAGNAPYVFRADEHEGWELAVLQRITLKDGRIVFLCAGKDAPGSRLAAEYLAANWDALRRESRGSGGDFAHLYRFQIASGEIQILG